MRDGLFRLERGNGRGPLTLCLHLVESIDYAEKEDRATVRMMSSAAHTITKAEAMELERALDWQHNPYTTAAEPGDKADTAAAPG